jgi:membrane protein implicated in regulation of membrane protease activity
MHPAARAFVTLIVWAATAAVLAPICFFGTILLAGPHSDMLPSLLQPPVLLLGWAIFLVAPIWIARRVWRRTQRPEPPSSPAP